MLDVDLGWSLADIAQAVNGDLVGDTAVVVSSVGSDSRDVAKGSLFVALSGENFDGHAFADAALGSGASAVLVDRSSQSTAMPRIEVDSTQDALLALAAKRRSELTMPVIAITGSAGKTSTKDLIGAGLDGSWSSPRSFNNEIGVPLTVLATPDDATALVLEVGSRGRGHIAWLADAIRPDIAVITNLGVVHLETFGTTEILADAKFELVELLTNDGVAVLPADESRLHRPGSHTTITFGDREADVLVSNLRTDELGYPSFSLVTTSDSFDVALAVAGAHQAANAAAALCVALALEVDPDTYLQQLATTTGSAWRMDVHPGRFTVINDAYNANPQSMASGLRTLEAMAGGKKIAVVGPMAELGSVCEEQHASIGRLASSLGIHLLVVGPDHGYVVGGESSVSNAADLEEAADTLHAILEPGDVVLVKASRSAGLERLALSLIEEATA